MATEEITIGNLDDIKIASASNSVWATVHDATTGSAAQHPALGYDQTAIGPVATAAPLYTISRCFFKFTIPAGITSISAVSLFLGGYNSANSTVSIQQGTQVDSPTTADYDSFTGSSFGTVVWQAGGFPTYATNEIVFNAAGISYVSGLVGSDVKFCAREYTYDYLDVTPPTGDYTNGLLFSNFFDTDFIPTLVITYTPFSQKIFYVL